MFVIGVILTIAGTLMIFSDMIKDPVNNLLPMMLPMVVGVVLLLVSGSIGLKKFIKFLSN
ncbi:hypothetical protein BG20_I1547 [Candidatus Nitrosarchaeum limnium BG20]|uniref:Uncharacterized protein n=2 Tax=Nitrosarchaeum TaxID=1007082 RepID=S2EIB1_9ARCH|nr:hypothetical protein BG20_I1547 [Candidatus Nitrosarchaeum limnium BG20]